MKRQRSPDKDYDGNCSNSNTNNDGDEEATVDERQRSKRAKSSLVNEASIDDLVPELVLEIVLSDVSISGSLARCSKKLLRILCAPGFLESIVDKALEARTTSRGGNALLLSSLPAWFTTFVPRDWMISQGEARINYSCDLAKLSSYTKSILSRSPDSSYFISGGIICQQLYGKEWNCDLDLWVPRQQKSIAFDLYEECDKEGVFPRVPPDVLLRESLEEYERELYYLVYMHEGNVDLICSRKDPRTSISGFDLSIVQQGVLFPSMEEYATPLSIYTSRTKRILVRLSPVSFCYKTEDKRTVFRSIRDSYVAHVESFSSAKPKHHGPSFHDCCKCLKAFPVCSTFDQKVDVREIYVRWAKRVHKYQKRFEGYDLTCYATHKSLAEDVKKVEQERLKKKGESKKEIVSELTEGESVSVMKRFLGNKLLRLFSKRDDADQQ